MNDHYERRALLLHLGSVLQTTSLLMEYEHADETLGELVESQPLLADVPLLEYAYERMTVRDFAAGALRAFCLWPQLLLEESLDRRALAEPVRERLFVDNPHGWAAYATSLRGDVPWFGDPLPSMAGSHPNGGGALRTA